MTKPARRQALRVDASGLLLDAAAGVDYHEARSFGGLCEWLEKEACEVDGAFWDSD